MTFDESFDRLIGHEGGYVNDARDPGGETKFGISKRQYPALDIANLTREDAKAIYRSDFWNRAACDQYAFGYDVFDAAVNSGIENAVRFLQRAVGVADDGHVGPATLAAIRAMTDCAVSKNFNAERLYFMVKLKTFDTYGRGWVKRVADILRGK